MVILFLICEERPYRFPQRPCQCPSSPATHRVQSLHILTSSWCYLFLWLLVLTSWFFGSWHPHGHAWLRFEGVSPFPCMQGLACPLCRFQDHGNSFTYTGSGGRDLSGNKRTAEQSCDQKLTNTNRFAEQSVTVSQAHICLILSWLHRGGAVFCFGGITCRKLDPH